MTAIVWDQLGQRSYESGIDRGVLYLEDGSGIPWNGLTSVEERFSTASVTPLYFEGLKYNEIVEVSEFSASLKAYTYPDEFLRFEGFDEPEAGFYVTGQVPPMFGLAYRTRVGNDLDSEAGYKLHILCNLNAQPSNKGYKTQSQNVSLIEFEWVISSIPERIPGFKPTSHLIIDSTRVNPDLLQSIEDILYGTDSTGPELPDFITLLDMATAA